MNWTLEVVVVPVSDLDRAKAFYGEQLGFVVDHDTRVSETTRVIQLTPPGSGCSIVIGKEADLVAVRIDGAEMQPCYDPMSHLVYVAGRQQVSHVWVAGRLLVAEQRLQNEAFAGLDTRLKLWQNVLGKRP